MPKLKRLRAYAIYAFCRYCDDWIDAAPPGSRRQAEEDLRNFTRKLLDEDAEQTLPAWAAAFRDTCLSCHVPEPLCHELIYGVCLDAEGNLKIPDWPALRKYCYYVASVVGLLMNCVFEPVDRQQAQLPAISMGIAMQLTNVLRDVREDALMGRLYLPSDELSAHGLAGADFRDADIYRTQQWRRYAAFFAARARSHYEAAQPGIALLPEDGSRYCVRCMSSIYGAILEKIESFDWDVSERRYVPFWKKIHISWAARGG